MSAGNMRLRVFAERAVRAVLDPKCANLPLPQPMLGQTRMFTFRFRPWNHSREGSDMTDCPCCPLGRRSLLGRCRRLRCACSRLRPRCAHRLLAPPQAAAGGRRPERGDRRQSRAHRSDSDRHPGARRRRRRLRAARPGHRDRDHQRPGPLRPVPPDRASGVHPGRRPRQGDAPNFQNWRAVGAQALVTGRAEAQGGGQIRVEFRLWDVLPQTQIQGTAYTTSQANWRRIAHIIADVIYERLLGEKGYFDTRIVYIAATGPRDRRTKRLAIMDQDSENNRFLTDGSWLVLTPRFHPTRDEIAFMSYANNRPRVYLFNLGNGQQRVLGEFPGMTFAPRFSPDGNSVVMSVATRRRIGHRQRRSRQPRVAAADEFRRDRLSARATARTAARSCSTPTAAATSSFI